MNEIVKVGDTDILAIEWNGERVITTIQLADVYGASEKQIKQNYNNNTDRFVKGKHFYILEGDELRRFKNQVENFDLVQKNTAKLYLWTRRGASRHCKMLGTDKAWNQFDVLEDNYYDIGGIKTSVVPDLLMCLQCVKFIADDLHVSESSKLLMYNGAFEEFGLPTSFLPKYEDNGNRERCSATELLRRNGCGMSVVKFNQRLLDLGYLEERERPSTKGNGTKKFKALTEKGLKYGVNLVNEKNQKEVQPYYYADTFMELYDLVKIK